jgi:hypothetical protein
MVLEAKYLHGIGAFEVCLFKVSALKLSHPFACPVFHDFSRFSLLRHGLLRGRVGVESWVYLPPIFSYA